MGRESISKDRQFNTKQEWSILDNQAQMDSIVSSSFFIKVELSQYNSLALPNHKLLFKFKENQSIIMMSSCPTSSLSPMPWLSAKTKPNSKLKASVQN